MRGVCVCECERVCASAYVHYSAAFLQHTHKTSRCSRRNMCIVCAWVWCICECVIYEECHPHICCTCFHKTHTQDMWKDHTNAYAFSMHEFFVDIIVARAPLGDYSTFPAPTQTDHLRHHRPKPFRNAVPPFRSMAYAKRFRVYFRQTWATATNCAGNCLPNVRHPHGNRMDPTICVSNVLNRAIAFGLLCCKGNAKINTT